MDGGDKSDETAKKLDEAKAEVTQLRAAVHDAVTVLKIAHETVARLAASPVAQAVSTRKSRCFKCPLSRVRAPLTALVRVDSANVRWKPDVCHGASVLPYLFHCCLLLTLLLSGFFSCLQNNPKKSECCCG